MISLVRVDDRLLHGQVICSWVPYAKADALVIASDEAAGDALASEVMSSCAFAGLKVSIMKVSECREAGTVGERVILVVGDLKDAMRIYEGCGFKTLNIGNIHHGDGRILSPSVIIDRTDEEIIERFISLGVSIDIRDVPATRPVPYRGREKSGG